MGHNFWHMVNKVMDMSDLLIEVVDARMIEDTRNREIEDRVEEKGKRLLIAINKCDLVDVSILEKEKKRLKAEGKDCVFLSARLRLGSTMLKKLIARYADGVVKVGILGFPNTGKSSIINVLKGVHAAPTSSTSNYTRAIREVRISDKVRLIDTPGVYPFGNISEVQLALICAKSPNQLKDPEGAAQKIIEIFLKHHPEKLEHHYKFKMENDDSYDILEQIGRARNKLRKGGEVDIDVISRIIIEDWQKGKITLEGVSPTDELNSEE